MKLSDDPKNSRSPDETGTRKGKAWRWATLLSAAVAAVLMVLLIQARVQLGESASVIAVSSKSFETPESAIRHFVDGLVAQELETAFEACAIRQAAEGFDFVAYAEWLQSIPAHSEAPTNSPINREFNRISRTARLGEQTRALTLSLCLNDDRFDQLIQDQRVVFWGSEDESLSEAFVRASNPAALRELKLVRIDTPMESLQTSPRGKENASKHSAIYGGDTMTERVVLYDLGGRLLVGGFSLIRYGEDWKIFQLSSNYAETSQSGAAETMTVEEYQSLLAE